MGNMRDTLRFGFLTGLPFALLALAAAAHAEQVRLDAAMATPLVLENTHENIYLRVALTGQPLPDTVKRAPVNITIVLDRSGSMQGQKIEAAKRAAKLAIDRLRSDDIISVVAYESTVEVLVPATRATDTEAIYDAIDAITANGSTALFAGVSKAAGEVRKFHSRDRVNRIILLSDGLANVGPSSPGELADLGASLGKEGICVTTLGLGLDYNEDLMTRLAMKSDGNHMFVENTKDLDRAYAMEFGDALSVVAQDVNIEITCAENVRPVRVLGREASIDGQKVRTFINQLGDGQTKYVLLEIEPPVGTADHTTDIARVEVSFADMTGGATRGLHQNVKIQYTTSKAEVEERTNGEIMASVVQQIGAERNTLAMRMRDEGRIEEARELLIRNNEFLLRNSILLNNEELRQDAGFNALNAQQLDDKDWNRQRKASKEYQYRVQQQSKELEKQP